jgi:hypothetical protein
MTPTSAKRSLLLDPKQNDYFPTSVPDVSDAIMDLDDTTLTAKHKYQAEESEQRPAGSRGLKRAVSDDISNRALEGGITVTQRGQ